MAGKITVDTVQLGDSPVASRNLIIKTNRDGSFTLTRGSGESVGTVDANGRVKFTANQIAFLVSFNGWVTNNTPTKPSSVGSVIQYNLGGAFNQTTMEFTAPVDGLYGFYFAFLRNPNNAVHRAQLYKNGAGLGSQLRVSEAFTGYNDNHQSTHVWPLLAGDKVDLRISSDTAGNIIADVGYNRFGGFFIS